MNNPDTTVRPNRPPTKTMKPPPRRKEEQVPAGDDSDINEGRESADVRDDRPNPKKENKPVEKDADSDKNGDCTC